MSAVQQTTVTPASVNHLVTVQLSSPPDAAKATVFPFRSCTVRLTVGSGFSVGFTVGWSNIYGHRPTLHTEGAARGRVGRPGTGDEDRPPGHGLGARLARRLRAVPAHGPDPALLQRLLLVDRHPPRGPAGDRAGPDHRPGGGGDIPRPHRLRHLLRVPRDGCGPGDSPGPGPGPGGHRPRDCGRHPLDRPDHQPHGHPGPHPVTTPFRLVVPSPIFESMLAHAREALPAECCGLLAGTVADGVGRVTLHLPLVNVLASPTEYESEPRSMLNAHKAMRQTGTDVLAVYHSHPASDPIASQKDRERNYSEQVVNLIVGMRGTEPAVRGWWLTSGGAQEAEWNVE